MLTEMMSAHGDHWRVVGITHDALQIFAENNFVKVSRMGINRAHYLEDRAKIFQRYLNRSWEIEEWWADFLSKDKTVLATSGENRRSMFERIHEIPLDPPLFISQGYAWRYGKKEENFLRMLFEKQLKED